MPLNARFHNIVQCEIIVRWRRDLWIDGTLNSVYVYPPGSPLLSVRGNLVCQLSLLLDACFARAAEASEMSSASTSIQTLGRLVTECLEEGEMAVLDVLKTDLNEHQRLHVEELSYNFLRTILQFFDLACLVSDVDISNSSQQIIFEMDPRLCGLVLCKHLLGETSTQQKARIPLSPTRVGGKITYDELANLWRTSGVNVRRIEREAYKKLKCMLKDWRHSRPMDKSLARGIPDLSIYK